MAVTAAMVKELRERTGAGMMECKKALVETDGDLDAAVEFLRKSGQAKADKKAGRVAADGRVVIAAGEDAVAVVEVNSETDFVAKDENFGNFAQKVAELVLARRPGSLDDLMAADLDGQSAEEARKALIAKVGENIGVRRFALVPADGNTGVYSHGARIGSVVVLKGGDEELARDIAMHVAATNPACISEQDVDPAQLESEKRILTEQARDSGKPAEIIEKMVEGRLRKWLSEITLVGQPFVKDPDVTVGKLLDKAGATVERFVRYEVGEGIEKKEENFAEEVMAQIKGA
ncbi:MAG: translation elongation factor Ts [Gammaproteobacteria bacterium]|jgi:elongation factor Ts